SEQIAFFYVCSKFHRRLPNPVFRTRNVISQIDSLHKAWRVGPAWVDLDGVTRQKAITAKHVLDPLVRVTSPLGIDGLGKTEFPANRDLSHGFRLVGQQARSHLTGVEQDKRCIEQAGHLSDFSSLGWIRNRMKRSAKVENRLVAARMNIQNHPHL